MNDTAYTSNEISLFPQNLKFQKVTTLKSKNFKSFLRAIGLFTFFLKIQDIALTAVSNKCDLSWET